MDKKQRIQFRADSIRAAWHCDAQDAYLFAQELEHMRTEVFKIEYPQLMAKKLIPVDNTVHPGADTVSYRQEDYSGKMTPAGQANMSGPGPRVGIKAQKFSGAVKHFRTSYAYSTQDLRAFAMSGRNGVQALVNAARESAELMFETVGAVGDSTLGIVGITNHASIPLVTLPNTGPWDELTPIEVLENLSFLENSVPNISRGVEKPNTLALDTESFNAVNGMHFGINDGKTVLREYLANSAYIKEVVPWDRLTQAGATASFHRAVCYRKDPSVLKLVIPLEFTQNPEVREGLEFVTECEARCGGVEIYKPLAIAHADIAVS